jgi:hypothetical protein
MTVAVSKLRPTRFVDTTQPHAAAALRAAVWRRPRASQHRPADLARRRWATAWLRLVASPRGAAMAVTTAILVLIAAGCSSKRVLVPPRMDLVEYYRLGLVTFTIENAKGDQLNRLATERFMTDVLGGQPGIEILELGVADAVLDEIGESQLGPRAARAIGGAHEVPAVFFGHITVSDVKPRGVLSGISLPHVEATVSVDLTVRLVSAESGGTLWSSRARAEETVGQLSLTGGDVYFSAEDPEDAYGRLVDVLVYEVTRDLRPSWVKQ